MSVIESVVAHFEAKEIKKIEVPEWGNVSGPLLVYGKPITLSQKAKLARLSKNEASGLELLAYALIELAKDSAGNPLFTLEDKRKLMTSADPDVMSRVASQLLNSDTVEIAEGN